MPPDPEMRELTLQVRHKSEIADGVFLFELRASDGGELAAVHAGLAHHRDRAIGTEAPLLALQRCERARPLFDRGQAGDRPAAAAR